jgi:prophage tail gpP-like protein
VSDLLTLLISGKKFVSWKTAEIRRSLESVAGGFALSVSDRATSIDDARYFLPGMACELKYGSDTLISGFIDSTAPVSSAGNHSIDLSGRDKTGILVDCSVIDCKSEYKNVTLKFVMDALLAPYGIETADSAGSADTIDSFAIQSSEKVFEALDRACRAVGYFATVNFKGQVVAARAGTERVLKPLVSGPGGNIKSASANFNILDRYAKYTVLAQKQGTDFFNGAVITKVTGSASDPEMEDLDAPWNSRQLVILAEKSMDKPGAEKRAQWEAAVRAGRSGTVSVVVTGWRDGDGNIWDKNKLIDVCIPEIFGDTKYRQLLIVETAFSLSSSGGTTTVLQLRRKDAYTPEPLKPAKTKEDPWADLRRATGSKIR